MKSLLDSARRLVRDVRGSVVLLFGLSLLPLLLMAGLSVDYSLYVRAQSQLNLAADTAAMHAARIASQSFKTTGTSSSTAIANGETAGLQWFNAQVGALPNVSIPQTGLSVIVVYTVAPGGFTATVTYSGTVKTTFGSLFNVTNWPISGSASSVITNSYVEVVMLLDNSSSMLIGSSTTDITSLEQATMCSTQSASAGQNMGNYSWNFPAHNPAYGYGSGTTPPPSTQIGSCYSTFTGTTGAGGVCFYPSALTSIINSSGKCVAGNANGVNGVPQAPCAFACHNSSTGNDYYALARSLNLRLRLDDVLSAAASVITTLQADIQSPNQFSVGVYQFNTALERVYPASGTSEAGTDLATAQTLTAALQPVVTANAADTDFVDSIDSLAGIVTAAGDGSAPTKPLKNLFIVTDGLEDSSASGARVEGPMTSATNEQLCQKFKKLGFTVYVLYTPYLPLPNPYYLTNIAGYAEPTATSPIITALQACATASTSSNSYFFQASSTSSINAAMQAMLKSALNSPSRIAN